MIKITAIEYSFEDIVERLCNGEEVYRINHERSNITNLGDKSINAIKRDEANHPNTYSYFVKEKEND